MRFNQALFGCVFLVLASCSNEELSELSSSDTLASPQILLENLKKINDSDGFLFGQQKASLAGIGEYGNAVFKDGDYGRLSDIEVYTGDKPSVLGIDVWDLATKNQSWNQANYAKAIRDFYADSNGGLINLEWHMRGCDTGYQRDKYGNSGIPGEGFYLNDWQNDSQRSCMCRMANETSWQAGQTWLDWLKKERLDRFADTLKREGLDKIPMVFRPFHEHTGSWFWWGKNSWDCKKHLGEKAQVSGPEAYKKVFREVVDYLKQKRGLTNLAIAYSTDKLCQSTGGNCQSQAAAEAEYLEAYPGDDYVDILGIDLYWADKGIDQMQSQTDKFISYMKAVSKLAKEKSKIAALTETGNYGLHRENFQSSDWFNNHLMQMINDPEISLAYVLTWENRRVESTQYYIPHKAHAGFGDFLSFYEDPKTLFGGDVRGLYSENLELDLVAKSAKPKSGSQSPEQIYPICQFPENDAKKDGWGWENGQSCRVVN